MSGRYDAIIVGGGPAGLSAALILGRCRRRVLVCDAGRPRNVASRALHGFLTRDGIAPAELLRIGRAQLRQYSVQYRRVEVTGACREQEGFRVTLRGGTDTYCRKLLLATGVVDRLPAIKGIEKFYGRSVFHCPYCDGWEVRGRPVAVYGRGRAGLGLALSLRTWTGDVILCSDGPSHLAAAQRRELERHGISLLEAPIAHLEGARGKLKHVVFTTGDRIARFALFFASRQDQRSSFPARLGCEFTAKGAVRTNRLEGTAVPGLYVAGDASRDVQLAIIAAAEGARAGFAINQALQEEDRA